MKIGAPLRLAPVQLLGLGLHNASAGLPDRIEHCRDCRSRDALAGEAATGEYGGGVLDRGHLSRRTVLTLARAPREQPPAAGTGSWGG